MVDDMMLIRRITLNTGLYKQSAVVFHPYILQCVFVLQCVLFIKST